MMSNSDIDGLASSGAAVPVYDRPCERPEPAVRGQQQPTRSIVEVIGTVRFASKLSPDPQLVEKIRDVVGLSTNPPTVAVVFAVDEHSQIQALERAQPILPMDVGQPERRTHEDPRSLMALQAAIPAARVRLEIPASDRAPSRGDLRDYGGRGHRSDPLACDERGGPCRFRDAAHAVAADHHQSDPDHPATWSRRPWMT